MSRERRASVERWLLKAEHDLRTARRLIKDESELTDVICFHCQQCAEKVFKAYLTFRNHVFERTHYLPELLEVCARYDDSFTRWLSVAQSLTDYAVTVRYPDDWVEIPYAEAAQAVKHAEELMEFVRPLITTSFDSD